MAGITNPPGWEPVGGTGAAKRSPARRVFQIVRWTIYACALFILLLVLHKAPPPRVETSPQAAARAEEKFQEVQQAVSRGQSATLRMDETELNSYLSSHLALSGDTVLSEERNKTGSAAPAGASSAAPLSNPRAAAPNAEDVEQMRSNVRDVKVQLIEDRVRAYVVFDVHGKDMTLQLEGRLGAENGYLRFEPVSGQLGSLPIPQSTLEAAVRRMMDSPENRDKLKLPAGISDLRIENGEIVAKYQ